MSPLLIARAKEGQNFTPLMSISGNPFWKYPWGSSPHVLNNPSLGAINLQNIILSPLSGSRDGTWPLYIWCEVVEYIAYRAESGMTVIKCPVGWQGDTRQAPTYKADWLGLCASNGNRIMSLWWVFDNKECCLLRITINFLMAKANNVWIVCFKMNINSVQCYHINGLVQDCSNSIANTLELLQSCTKPSTWWFSLQPHGDTICWETWPCLFSVICAQKPMCVVLLVMFHATCSICACQ